MKRPLVRVVCWYIAGLLVADLFSLPLFPLLGLTALASALGLIWPAHRAHLLPIALTLAGAANLTQDTEPFRPTDLRNLTSQEPIEVRLRGVLLSAPTPRPSVRAPGKMRSSAEVDAVALKCPGLSWRPAWGRVSVSTGDELAEAYQQGMDVEVLGVMQPPAAALAPGLFDYQAYLKRKGIYRILNVRSQQEWKLLSAAAPPSLGTRFQKWARETMALGLPRQDPIVSLLWAMTLGWRPGLAGEVSEPFMRSGTMHVFAISGLHILLITTILIGLLRFFRLSRSLCAWILLPTIWFYAAVTGWQASAVRSILMTSLVLAGWLLRRPDDLLNSLAAAALLLLLWAPQELFQIGFQLSFAVVLSLVVLEAVFKPLRTLWARPDPLRPLSALTWWQRQVAAGRHHLVTALITSLAAWLGSLPLVAHYFHFFTPVSLLANLFIVPLSSLALASTMGSLLTGAWCPALAVLFNHSAWLWMKLMTLVSQWSTALPGAWFHVLWPGPWAVAFYYAALAVAIGWRAGRRPAYAWPLLGFLGLLTLGAWHREQAGPRLTILPAEGAPVLYAGQSSFPTALLIDCGNSNAVAQTVLPFLRAQGINRLPLLVLTHGDQQHIAGADLLNAHLPVEQLCLGPTRFRSATYRKLQETWRRAGRLRTLQPNQHIGAWLVLHPGPEDRFSRADDASLVLFSCFYGTRVLVCADLGRAGQRTLMERWPDLRADIVISGIPAAEEPLSALFLEAIQPRLIIIADTLYPASARASHSVTERLGAQRIPVLYTHQTGALTLRFRPRKGWKLTAQHRFLGQGEPPDTITPAPVTEQSEPRRGPPRVERTSSPPHPPGSA